jgi:hypothetical protein
VGRKAAHSTQIGLGNVTRTLTLSGNKAMIVARLSAMKKPYAEAFQLLPEGAPAPRPETREPVHMPDMPPGVLQRRELRRLRWLVGLHAPSSRCLILGCAPITHCGGG